MIGETPIYQRIEKSKTGPVLIAIGVILLCSALFLPNLAKNSLFIFVPVSLFLILMGYLTSRLYINGYFDRLVVRYGTFGPLKVTVQYSQIRAIEQMKIPAILRMHTGLRINFGGWFFNPGTSADAVKIEYGKHKAVTVGTADPDGLKNFIEQKMAQGMKFS